MTREQIIEEVYNSNVIKDISNVYKSYLGPYRKDFISYMYEILCAMNDNRLIQLYNDKQLTFYLYYVGKAQSNNQNSDFWRLYKGKLDETYISDIDTIKI